MKKYRKITNYLYLGGYEDKPDFCSVTVSAASDFFDATTVDNSSSNHDSFLSADKKTLYLNLSDYPEIGKLNETAIIAGLNFIHEHVNQKNNVYVHCVWGVNRSATLVFLYLVLHGVLNQDNFQSAWKQFVKIYPRANPNPAYAHYLHHYFPYRNLIK